MADTSPTFTSALREYMKTVIGSGAIPELLHGTDQTFALMMTGSEVEQEFIDGGKLCYADFDFSCRGSRAAAFWEPLSDATFYTDAPFMISLFYIVDIMELPVMHPEIDLGERRTALKLEVLELPKPVSASGGMIKYLLRLRLTYYEEGGN